MVAFLLTLIVLVSVSQIDDTMTLMMLQAKYKNNINCTIEKKTTTLTREKLKKLQLHVF